MFGVWKNLSKISAWLTLVCPFYTYSLSIYHYLFRVVMEKIKSGGI